MFSGIVSNVGIINQIIRKHEGAILTVRGGDDFRGFASGESIAVNGVCLTVRDITKDTFAVDFYDCWMNLRFGPAPGERTPRISDIRVFSAQGYPVSFDTLFGAEFLQKLFRTPPICFP